MTRPRVVAVDGAAGSGKSTLARGLARHLGLAHVNTGSMYRALTARALAGHVVITDPVALGRLLADLRFELGGADPPELCIDGRIPGAELETTDVEDAVSTVASHPSIRDAMRKLQRGLGERGAVVEGRDITTVVFPDAPVRIYLEAEPELRAARRTADRPGATEPAAPAGDGASLHVRDARDATVNPFEPAPGSVVIDTTALSKAETLAAAIAVVERAAPELLT